MLNINILHLINHKILPIKYIITPTNKNKKNKYITNILNTNILELLELLNSLSIAYLHIYKYVSLKQKILISSNYIHHISMLKSIAALTTNYYIYNTTYSQLFSNWNLLKKKLILYKWLKYFFLSKLAINNKYKNTIYLTHTLYLLYLKLKLKYHGLKNLYSLPNTLIFIVLNNNNLLKEISKLNKNIIFISNNNSTSFHLSPNNIKIITRIHNFSMIQFILKIINTAIIHGIIS